MSCPTFFQPYFDWLNSEPPNGGQNVINFMLSSGRNESNHFVLYSVGWFTLEPVKPNPSLWTASARVYFSDRYSIASELTQPFDVKQSEIETINLDLQGLTLQRLNHTTNSMIGLYQSFQCNGNGLLVCTSTGTKEMLILSFWKGISEPIQ